MNSKEKKSARREVRAEGQSIRTILHQWNPIDGAPPDEYDCLIDHVLGALHRGATIEGIVRILTEQFDEHFGISMPNEEVRKNAQLIWQWWVQRKNEREASNQAL